MTSTASPRRAHAAGAGDDARLAAWPRAGRAGGRLPHRPAASRLGPRPRPRDGRRGPVGRAARRARDLAAAGHLSAGHGVRRLPRAPRRSAARRRDRASRPLGDPARRDGRDAIAAAALAGRGRGRVVRDLPRARARHRVARRAERACSTASASWSPPGACMRPGSRSGWSIAGSGGGSPCVPRARWSRPPASSSSGGRSLDPTRTGRTAGALLVLAPAARTRTSSTPGSARSTTASRTCS